jgi:hypothetical protein
MNDYAKAKQVVGRIRRRFPDEAQSTDEWLRDRGWEELDEAPHVWVEAFADRTTEAAHAKDWNRVKDQTEFMAAEYRGGSDDVRKLIDVSYAENLMWDLEKSAKVTAWQHVAKEVRDLYEQMWGLPMSRR